jgi:hypothetical protein
MIRQLKQFHVLAGGMDAAAAEFPRRPDASIISATIPLFYIAQNRDGFWLARAAAGGNGGLFLFRRSAVRFAKRHSKQLGCATMFLSDSFELDVPNQGSRFIARLAAAIDFVTRRAPPLASFVRMAAAEWRRLIVEIAGALASKRKHRAAIEQELFGGQYVLSSKNDDDLPIP